MPRDPDPIPARRWTARIAAAMAALASLAYARPGRTLLLAGAVAAGCLGLSATRLGIDTDTTNMLSEDLPFRRAHEAHRQAFPQFANLLLVVVEGPTATATRAGAQRLTTRLATLPELRSATYAAGYEVFRRNGLLLLPAADRDARLAGIERAAPLVGALAANPDLRGLAGVLGLAMEEAARAEPSPQLADSGDPGVALAALLNQLARALGNAAEGRGPVVVDFEAARTAAGAVPKIPREVIEVQARQDFGSLSPAGPAMRAIRAAAQAEGLTPDAGWQVRLTGGPALGSEELKSVESGIGLSGVLSLLLVGAVMLAGLGSPRLSGAILVAVLVGLVWTAGFATLAIGDLNLISVAFAIYFIALGVDFGIHLGLAHRGALVALPGSAAMAHAARAMALPLLLCMATTVAAFLAFVPTSYRGIAELGIISAFGMVAALAATFTVLPALLRLVGTAPLRPLALEARGWALMQRRPRWVIGASVVAGIGCLGFLPSQRFDLDPVQLQDPRQPSVLAFRDLVADPRSTPMRGILLAGSEAEAEALASRAAARPEVAGVITLARLLPADQTNALAAIGATREFVGPLLEAMPPPTAPDPASAAEALTLLRTNAITLAAAPGAARPARAAARDLEVAIARLGGDPDPKALEAIDRSIGGGIRANLAELAEALSPTRPLTRDALPPELLRRFIAADGRTRVEVLPKQPMGDQDALVAFARALIAVTPDAIGGPAMIYGSGLAVKQAFAMALGGAMVVIVVLLRVYFRNWRDTGLVLAPLVLAALLTNAYGALMGLDLNFANVIVIPLLLGIGVAGALHLVAHARAGEAAHADRRDVGPPPLRATVASFLATLFAFATLALSDHRGTASLGELHAVSVLFSLLTTVTLLPALLALERRRIG